MQWTLPLIPISCIYPDTIPVYPALMDFILYFSVLYNLNPISSLHSVFIFSVSCLYLLCIMFIYSLYHVYLLWYVYVFSVSCLYLLCIMSFFSRMFIFSLSSLHLLCIMSYHFHHLYLVFFKFNGIESLPQTKTFLYLNICHLMV